jgi:formate dehydrogenase iron-sulfur subunit
MTRIYVPRDSSALALGADALAQAIGDEAARRGIDIELVRNGSRGLLWLEPLLEVATAEGRVGYANVEAEDVAALFDAGFLQGGEHARRVGLVDEIPYLKKQQRLTFARIGITDPLAIDDYVAHGGLDGLRAAAARRSRPASKGAPCAAQRRRRSTSSAMRMRVTPARSPIAW